MISDIAELVERLEKASSYVDIFTAGTHTEVKKTYLSWAKVLHPDVVIGIDKQRASDALMILIDFYHDAQEAIRNDRFGRPPQITITSSKQSYKVEANPLKGDICDLFIGNAEAQAVWVKMARSPHDNDLIEAEQKALTKIDKDGDNTYAAFTPTLLESFTYLDNARVSRRANVLERIEGFVDLRTVREMYYPNGVHVLDMIWMWRRLLIAMGYAHDAGIIHGAVTPEHIVIHPEEHGLILIDWCYSVTQDSKRFIEAVPPQRKGWYPQEVLTKETPSTSTDIYLAARSMVYLLGGNPTTGVVMQSQAPKGIRAFLRGCSQALQPRRPDNAFEVLEEFDELLERLGDPFHPRRFRSFVLNPNKGD